MQSKDEHKLESSTAFVGQMQPCFPDGEQSCLKHSFTDRVSFPNIVIVDHLPKTD